MMSAHTSAAMQKAIRLINGGATLFEASRKTKLWPQSIARAIKNNKEKADKIALENNELTK